MNITQAGLIYSVLSGLSEDDDFWDDIYTKEKCFETCPMHVFHGHEALAAWYTEQKQYHWAKPIKRLKLDQLLIRHHAPP